MYAVNYDLRHCEIDEKKSRKEINVQ